MSERSAERMRTLAICAATLPLVGVFSMVGRVFPCDAEGWCNATSPSRLSVLGVLMLVIVLVGIPLSAGRRLARLRPDPDERVARGCVMAGLGIAALIVAWLVLGPAETSLLRGIGRVILMIGAVPASVLLMIGGIWTTRERYTCLVLVGSALASLPFLMTLLA